MKLETLAIHAGRAIDPGTGETLWTYRLPHTERWEYSMRADYGKGIGYAEIDGRGVDRSQIRRQLELPPFERLKAVESFLASTLRIRRGLRRTAVSPGSAPPR